MTSFIKLKNGISIFVSEFLKSKYNLGEGCNTFGSEDNPFFMELMKEASVEKALKIVTSGFKTEEEVKKRLLDQGYYDYGAAYALEKLKDYKYINDLEYVKQYIMSKKDGRLKIIFDLEKKGIEKEIVDNIYSENTWIEEENMKYYIEKNFKKTQKQKFGILARHGFDEEKIKEVLELEDDVIL